MKLCNYTDRVSRCIFVRDASVNVGGFESWVERLAVGLPSLGIDTITLLVCSQDENVEEWNTRLSPSRVIAIQQLPDEICQAEILLQAIHDLSKNNSCGVFFTQGYRYINLVGINLGHSPWLVLPVMHGWHPSAYDWVCLGPPRKIIAPSADLQRECGNQLRKRIGWLRSLRKAVFIPHGVPLPLSDLLEKKFKSPVKYPIRLAAVSRLNEDTKRPWDYLKVAEELSRRKVNFHLTIGGDGPSLVAMKVYANEHGLDNEVSFVGALIQSSVYDLLLGSDIFLATSESEAFGLSVAEALACGCAVVSSDVQGEIQRTVTKQTGFRVPVGNVTRFADCVARLADNPGIIRKMGRQGSELVEGQYSIDRMTASYASLLKKLFRHVTPNPNWQPAGRLYTTPGEVVGPGLLKRLGVPSFLQRH